MHDCDKAPQENGHVIHVWKNWPTLKTLEPAWNMNRNVWDFDGKIFVNHAEDPGQIDYKKTMRLNSERNKTQPVWYQEIAPDRRKSRAVRVRFYARKLKEIGLL